MYGAALCYLDVKFKTLSVLITGVKLTIRHPIYKIRCFFKQICNGY